MPRRLESAEHDVVLSCWVEIPLAELDDVVRCDFTFPDGRPEVTVTRQGPGPLPQRAHDRARAVALDVFAERFPAEHGGFSISRAMGADPDAVVWHHTTTWTPWHGHLVVRLAHHRARSATPMRDLADELHPPVASKEQHAAVRQAVQRILNRGGLLDRDKQPTARARELAAEYELAALPKPS